MSFSRKGGTARWSAALLALALLGAACGGDDGGADDEGGQTGTSEVSGDSTVKDGGTLVFGADQDFGGYNVNTSKGNQLAANQAIRLVWATAYRARPDFSMEPYLLAEEAAIVSQDPFTVEWKIQPKATWSDGVPVSADDFEFIWLMCNGSKKTADCANPTGYDLITKLEKPDPKTVRTVFKQPYADYKSLFPVVPSHIAKQRGGGDDVAGWNTGFNDDPGAAAGPYKVEGRVRGDSLTLVRNESFWGKPAHLDKITFRFLPESLTQPDALRNGEVKMIYPQPQLDQVQIVEEIGNVKSEINFGPTFEHLTFNMKNEFLSNVEVRRAIAYGVDRTAIVNRLMLPFSEKASQLDNRVLVSSQKGYEAHGADYAKANVKKAQDLLVKAGFTKGAGGIFEKDGKKLQLRLSTTAGNDLREQQETLIQQQLKLVGIDIRIDNTEADDLFNKRLPEGNFDIANFAWVGTPFPASGANQIYNGTSASNFGRYANKKVDDLMLKALGTVDETARLEVLNQLDEAMWDDLPNLPLYQKPTFLAYYESYGNISDNTTSESPFWNAEEWGLKATAK